MTKLIVFIIAGVFFISCQKAPVQNIGPSPNSIPKGVPQSEAPRTGRGVELLKVSVMAYNLENLFDDVQDSNETVIPTSVLEKKLARLAQAILQIDGKGPDVLMVEEVENLRVLKMLNQSYLKAAGYQTVELLESDDERGIDVGIFSRFPLVEGQSTQLHRMPFSDINTTRGILEVPLQLSNGRVLRAFAYHFPSQANPVDQRRQAAEYLRDLMKAVSVDEYVVAGGDSNITGSEEQKQNFFHQTLADFQVSHLVGCQDCKGTYAYRGRWDFLDAIITRESVLQASSVRIPSQAPTQLKSDQTPQRFNAKTGEGMSDHLPIFAEILVAP